MQGYTRGFTGVGWDESLGCRDSIGVGTYTGTAGGLLVGPGEERWRSRVR